ncbi:DNA-binding transcriptional regulator, GntR family [Tranquillimonas rosea]|uniref:DNA-binding transcriptional regulator, GntR family n=1 Tax=Tranquillimonas rosea TaxID=641238 RepID=A0A1H9WJ69_9RHOB|nr:GntR family transcriptional regulator [Tranquillimonas rosea]SES33717.1 DNA-binding transcriptional regulator, GntR family [Tranquillimonas rosea]
MTEAREQTAYQDIKAAILDGRIEADTILSERSLAVEFGVSRTPLRGALSRLERESVIARLENGALLVRSVSIEHLLEIVQLRAILEGTAARRAAERGSHAALDASAEEMRRFADGATVGFDTFWAADDRFHDAVAEAAGYALLPGILAEQRATARRCTITRVHDRFDEQAREHLAVVEAILAGDGDAAEAAMERHFDNVRRRFLDWLGRQ